MKKILALVIALAMVLLTVGAAMADDDPAVVVTINPNTPANAGASTTAPTYTYYVMMKASVGTGTATSYYVDSANSALATALDGLSITKNDESVDLFTVTLSADGTRYNVVPAEGLTDADGPAIATALQTIKSNAIATGTATNNTIGLDYDAYILVESSLGTKLAANTVVTRTIIEKNEYPGNTKTEDKTDVSLGEVVTYTVTVNIPANAANLPIKVVDTITNGLTMNTAITVSGDQNEDTDARITSLTFAQTGTIAADASADPAVKAATIYEATIPAATVYANRNNTLTLEYTATVNANAIVNDPEVNKAHIEYDNFKSVDVDVEVITHGFTVRKIDGANVTEGMTDAQKLALTALAGAEFSLWTESTGGSQIKVVSDGTDLYKVDPTATTSAVLQGGEFTIRGLAAGTYYLQEDKAPDGYNKLTNRIPVAASASTSPVGVDYAIENNAGTTLPSTGGIGTTIFYIVGGLLVIGAAVILVARRKSHE